MYWIELVKDLFIWYKYARAAKANKRLLRDKNMRVDWVGRIYTVVNMPEEVSTTHQKVQEGWVLQQLNSYNETLLNIGLADYTYPEIRKIPNSLGYLILLYPELETISIWQIIKHTIIYGSIFLLCRLIYLNVDLSPIINLLGKISW